MSSFIAVVHGQAKVGYRDLRKVRFQPVNTGQADIDQVRRARKCWALAAYVRVVGVMPEVGVVLCFIRVPDTSGHVYPVRRVPDTVGERRPGRRWCRVGAMDKIDLCVIQVNTGLVMAVLVQVKAAQGVIEGVCSRSIQADFLRELPVVEAVVELRNSDRRPVCIPGHPHIVFAVPGDRGQGHRVVDIPVDIRRNTPLRQVIA